MALQLMLKEVRIRLSNGHIVDTAVSIFYQLYVIAEQTAVADASRILGTSSDLKISIFTYRRIHANFPTCKIIVQIKQLLKASPPLENGNLIFASQNDFNRMFRNIKFSF